MSSLQQVVLVFQLLKNMSENCFKVSNKKYIRCLLFFYFWKWKLFSNK